jgi:transcriptional antiterminator RfaH
MGIVQFTRAATLKTKFESSRNMSITLNGNPLTPAEEQGFLEDARSSQSIALASPAWAQLEAWFCVRAQQKREHFAAANLRRYLGLDVFNPRFRYRKATRRGMVWTPEPVFPGYVFARFDLATCLERVKYTAGVSSLVRFGDKTPVINDEVISDLRTRFPPDEMQELDDTIEERQEVTIAFGKFAGLTARVLRTLSASRRVQVLLDFLGYTAKLDLPREQVIVPRRYGNLALAAQTN